MNNGLILPAHLRAKAFIPIKEVHEAMRQARLDERRHALIVFKKILNCGDTLVKMNEMIDELLKETTNG